MQKHCVPRAAAIQSKYSQDETHIMKNTLKSLIARTLVASVVMIVPAAFGQDAAPATKLPTDAGVYMKSKSGEWIEVDPEVVNWKSGGVMKSAISYGVVKGDINGHLKGGSSPNKLIGNELVVVVPEGTGVTEYQLLRMHEHSKDREFRAATGGVFHESGGSDRDFLEFQHKKIASRTYSVTIPDNLKDGEYGLLPPGAGAAKGATSIGKVYSFTLSRQ